MVMGTPHPLTWRVSASNGGGYGGKKPMGLLMGYMAATGHFIDESWKLRSILMGFIYVPAPHTGDVIAEELHETLMQWNLDEKLLSVIVDNCTSNDKEVGLMVSKIGKSKLLLQGTDYVSANVFFPKICEIKMKIRQWATSTDLCIQEMSNNMIDKFDKYWTDIQGLMGIATLLDPRYKKHMLVACFAMLHGIASTSDECIGKVDYVVANLHRLIEEYELDGDEYQQAEECSFSEKPSPAIMSFFHDIVAQQKPIASRLQGEIEHYLSDDLVPYTEKFSVLDWWKVAGTRYPTLRKVARDIFAIPITSVASESAFSTSGRIVDEHRGCLTSHMLEVLMCYQDWLRNKYKGFRLDLYMNEK
ncbi:hypothetical protein ACQ4PT_010719 [Festuca glaucescens]